MTCESCRAEFQPRGAEQRFCSPRCAARGRKPPRWRDKDLPAGATPAFPGSKVGHIVDAESGCWIWIGFVHRNGYGSLTPPGGDRSVLAHRYYFERHRFALGDMSLDHVCRVRRCVNPDHLEPVTARTNVRRGLLTKLTPDAVRAIRDLYAVGAETMKQIGARFGVSAPTVHSIVRGHTWADVI